jgi:hypothetical protein
LVVTNNPLSAEGLRAAASFAAERKEKFASVLSLLRHSSLLLA